MNIIHTKEILIPSISMLQDTSTVIFDKNQQMIHLYSTYDVHTLISFILKDFCSSFMKEELIQTRSNVSFDFVTYYGLLFWNIRLNFSSENNFRSHFDISFAQVCYSESIKRSLRVCKVTLAAVFRTNFLHLWLSARHLKLSHIYILI